MSSPRNIDKTLQAFASQYDVQLDLVAKETDSLKNHIKQPHSGVSSIDIYKGHFVSPIDAVSATVPDIETINFSDVKVDPKLTPRFVEQNLDEANEFCRKCLSIRAQYRETAKLRNDVRFKFEEFVRLDEIHIQEVKAGLYKLPWQDMEDELVGLEAALQEANASETAITNLLNTGDVSTRANLDYVAKHAKVARNSATRNHDVVETDSTSTGTTTKNIERASWSQRLHAAKENVAQLNAKVEIGLRKVVYLKSDEVFRAQRAAVSRNLALMQIQEHARDNSALNYDQQLKWLASRFTHVLTLLIERLNVVHYGLAKFYGINPPVLSPATGEILDSAATWLNEAADQLSKHKKWQKLLVLSEAGSLHLTDDDGSGTTSFSCGIDLNNADLPGTTVLLRGIAIEYIGDLQRPISVIVTPPEGATETGDEILIGRVCPFSVGLELGPRNADYFWNGSPQGTWQLRGSFDSSGGSINELIVHFWVAVF